MTLIANTKFAHSQDTKVYAIKYNVVRFFRTTVATFSSSNILGTIAIQADSAYTVYQDTTNTTGFAWFVFMNVGANPYSGLTTTNSNAIPYADFNEYAVKKILDSFFSILNNKERTLIDTEDAFRWLNEGYSIAKNQLNLVNNEYSVTTTTINATAGTQEYALPSDFSDVVVLTDSNGNPIYNIPNENVPLNDNNLIDIFGTHYYLRGTYIGFSPSPADAMTYTLRYKQKATILTSYYDDVNLPDNNYYGIVDYMMYRAGLKLSRPDAVTFKNNFNEYILNLKLVSHKQNNSNDSWGILSSSNI